MNERKEIAMMNRTKDRNIGMQYKVIGFILAVMGFALGAVAATEPMNVLFIVIDDLRPEIGCYGNPEMKTPNIDRLAAKGVLFNRAYAQYPLCNPSRASFLTGLRPDELDVYSNEVALREKRPNVITLPQIFRNNGYFTASIGKIVHTGLDENGKQVFFRDDLSFDHFFSARNKTPAIGGTGKSRKLGNGKIPWAFWRQAEGGDESQMDGMNSAEAIRVLEEHHDKPFFIGVGFHKPHDPFIAPKKYFESYPLDEIQLAKDPADCSPLHKHAFNVPELFTVDAEFKERDCREFKRAYMACTTFVDAQVGKLLATMDQLELWDNTIVVLLGDHGYFLGERNWWNKLSVLELGARGPMMMWVPGGKGMGRTTDSIVEFLDLYPTLTDFCGITATNKLSGQSLRPVLENSSKGWKNDAFTQVLRKNDMMGYSIRTDRWRLIQWGAQGEDGYELYDHSKDEGEYYDLANNPEYKQIKMKLVNQLKEGFPVLVKPSVELDKADR